MSFENAFSKIAKVSSKTGPELQYKANKHIRKIIKYDKAAYKGGALGTLAGGAVGGAQMARGKYGKLQAVGATALGTLAGAAVGGAKRAYHSAKGGKYYGELISRGYRPKSMDPSTGYIKWKPPRVKAQA